MSNKMTGKVLAVQLGRVESYLALTGGAGEVLHAVTMSTPYGAVDDGEIRDPDAVRAMLKDALSDPAFEKARKVVFTLCTSQVISETVRTPDLPEVKLSKLLRANADMYFPVDIADYRLVWQVVGSVVNQDGMKELSVQLWAVPAHMLKPYYAVANGCGLSVAAIDYCGHSMASVAGASFAKVQKNVKEHKKLDLNMEISFGSKKKVEPVADSAAEDQGPQETQLFLSLDKELLGMTFVQNQQVVMQRIIRCGSQLVYQFGELSMMLEYFQSMDVGRGSVIHGFASGFYANSPDILEELADVLGISVVPLALSYDLTYCLCASAVRTELDFGNASLNVVDKARREVESQLWQYGLLLAGGLVLILVVLFTLTSRLAWNSDIRKLESQQQTLTIQAQKVAGFADNYNDYVSKYNAYSSDWDAVFGNLQTYNDNLVLVMEELEELMPDHSSVAGMRIEVDGLNVTFACEDKEEAAYLIMALRDMDYADLMVVSDLQGGGSGPAKTYGSGKETAPKEGSADMNSVQMDMLKASINVDLDPYKVAYYLGMGSKAELELLPQLEEAYGLQVENEFATFAELAMAKGEQLTYQKRADTFWAMCTSNPFAMNAAEGLILQDYAEGGELFWYIYNRLEEEGYGINEVTRHRSVEELQEHIELLAGIIVTYNPEYDAMGRVEELICSDPKMEAWYLYYLEAELAKVEEPAFFGNFAFMAASVSMEEEEPLPYLDLDKVTQDLVSDRAFSSYDADLNNVLFTLMSERTLALVDAINPPEIPDQPGQPENPDEPDQPGQPENPDEPDQPGQPENPGEPDDGDLDPTYANILKTYLPGYLTKDELPSYGDITAQVETALDKYFETGASGEGAKYDDFLNDYIDSKAVDAELTQLIEAYKLNPDGLANQSVRKMLDNYYNGGTGNIVLNAWAERCDTKSDAPETESTGELILKTYLPTYLKEGHLVGEGDRILLMERALNQYFEGGNMFKPGKYDEFLNNYIASKVLDKELTELIAVYKENPKELTNQSIRKMLDKFYGFWHTTGNDVLNEWIERCDPEITPPTTEPSEPSEPGEELDPNIELALATYLPNYLKEDKLPDHDMAEAIGTALDAYFETGKSGTEYDKYLDKYIKDGKADQELIDLLAEYKADPASLKNQSIRKMLDNYYGEAKTAGNTALDEWIKRCESGEVPPETEDKEELDETYATLLKTYLPAYLTEGTLPSYGDVTATVKTALDSYFETGASGEEKKYDNFLDEYIATKAVDKELTSLIYAYQQDPAALKNQSIRKMLDNYYGSKKTTGNEVLDAWIERCAADQDNYADNIINNLTTWLSKYLTSGTCGDTNGNAIIELYLTTGKTESEEYTKILDNYVGNGKVDAALKNLLKIYLYNKSTLSKYPALLTLFDNYYKGTTGSQALNAQIKAAAKALANEANTGSGGGSGGGSGEPEDTRIYFAVILKYKEELLNSELTRKGLDPTKKIEMLEVGK